MALNRHLLLALLIMLLSPRQTVCKLENKDGMPLSRYIHHFEPLNYDVGPLDAQHNSQPRNHMGQLYNDSSITWKLTAFGRSFHLQLSPYSNVVSPGAQLNVVSALGVNTTDMVSQLYRGVVIGDERSSVYGHIINGTFDGIIKTDYETFHIEPSFRYFSSPRPGFRSVIYRARDIHLEDQPITNRSATCQLCSLSWDGAKLISPKMYTLRGNKDPDKRKDIFPHISLSEGVGKRKLPTAPSNSQSHENILLAKQSFSDSDWLQMSPDEALRQSEGRTPRDAVHLEGNHTSGWHEWLTTYDRPSKTCMLHVVVDHTFFEHVAGGDVSLAAAEVAFHITEADSVYRATDFDGDGRADNVGLAIGGMTIFESVDAQNYLVSGDYPDAEEFLTDVSLYNFSAYCMGLAFTYRDFAGGILGLAWMGYPGFSEPPGGICQSQITYRNDGHPSSLNTAMVTLVNYDTYVPRSVSVTSVMHELGHGFGSPHDPRTRSCSPAGPQGNYIMSSQATDGNQPNNIRFSTCSRGPMAAVIATKGALCLQADSGPHCGNGLVEQGEECDCGTALLCHLADRCCTPKGGAGSDAECTFRRQLGRVCSPVTSPCCDDDCRLIPASWHKHCFEDDECLAVSFCNGSSADCPPPVPSPNGTPCQDGAKRCLDGQCSLTACSAVGLPECFCSDVNSTGQSCQLCCQHEGDCIPAVEFGLTTLTGDVILKQPGSSCDNYTGYCDLQGLCVTTDSDSALNKLKNFFKEGRGPIHWTNTHWYYIACAVLSFCFSCLMAKLSYDNRRYLQNALLRMRHPRSTLEPAGAHQGTGGAEGGHGVSLVAPASHATTAGLQFLLESAKPASPTSTQF
ncbi:disintegrin and metalloproteinase domain-containing protein 10-like [Acanthaster planci]|uniref:ADAM10 endopeptidase n=1 Tax=Acanthaster planci TaxID=133434 RepID=A0A8B7YGD5_ACAPL|nr:disintegrin and metalloproteinase domain-containing protein 10-like [Acanthaster planci]